MEYDYFREFGIKQVYISDYLANIHKDIFYNEYQLLKYKNNDKSTLFVGIRDEYDVKIIKNHKGGECIFIIE